MAVVEYSGNFRKADCPVTLPGIVQLTIHEKNDDDNYNNKDTNYH